jgi:anti-anti-sigma regulatory factor
MQITVEQAQGRVPVTILGLHGDLDASNFENVIAKAKDLYVTGTRYVVIDFTHVPFMGSSGLVALHSIALLMRGEAPPDPEAGWHAFHAIDPEQESDAQQHVKLLNPQPRVNRTLELTGMNAFFDIYTDLQTAVHSF